MEFIVNGVTYDNYDEAKKAEDAAKKETEAKHAAEIKRQKTEQFRILTATELNAVQIMFCNDKEPDSYTTHIVACLAPELTEQQRIDRCMATISRKFGEQYTIDETDTVSVAYRTRCLTYEETIPVKNSIMNIILHDHDITKSYTELDETTTLYSTISLSDITVNETMNAATNKCQHNCGECRNNCQETHHEKFQSKQAQPTKLSTPFGEVTVYSMQPQNAADIMKMLESIFI